MTPSGHPRHHGDTGIMVTVPFAAIRVGRVSRLHGRAEFAGGGELYGRLDRLLPLPQCLAACGTAERGAAERGAAEGDTKR